MTATVTVRPFGDAAFLVATDGLDAARGLARALEGACRRGTAPAGIVEVVAGFDSVVVVCEPGTGIEPVLAWLRTLRPDPPRPSGPEGPGPATVEIPVDFDGPDLEEAAERAGLRPAGVVEQLTAATLEVALLGFAPGFPYLVGLPPALAGVGRRPSPRPAVPAGSVAIGGGFASVYPRSSPGGWLILGHTTARLFDPHRSPFALLRAGDVVRFSTGRARPSREHRASVGDTGVDTAADAATDRARPSLAEPGSSAVAVVEPGVLSLVQDAGRRGVAALGVPAAGPLDAESMHLANALVGNDPGEACIEVTARGPTLRFDHHTHVAVVAAVPEGVEVRLEGRPVGADVVVPVQAGQTLGIGRVRAGLRAYLAVSGGIRTPPVVGSRSSDQLSGLGHGPLRVGDRLGVGSPGRPHGQLSRPAVPADPAAPVRVVLGPHPFPREATDGLCAASWSVGVDSNRIGLRLEGGAPLAPADVPVTSTGMVTGAIQVPPDGRPIVLLADHATVGGYPVIACVVAVDLPRLGQARPGDRLEFVPVDPEPARLAYRQRSRQLAGSVTGWFPTATAT